jgi:hypothetical protein
MKMTKATQARTLLTFNPELSMKEIAERTKLDLTTVYHYRKEMREKSGQHRVYNKPTKVVTSTTSMQAKQPIARVEELAVQRFIENSNLSYNLGNAVGHIAKNQLREAIWFLNRELALPTK